MSFSLLFKDELKGFYKSKVMLFLWVGLPALVIVLYLTSPDAGEISLASLTAMLVGSLGGVLASVMLVVSIVNERERHVYDLFVIRPVKRRDIVLSKFSAVYACVATAGLLAFAVSSVTEYVVDGSLPAGFGDAALGFFVVAFSMMAISCSAGLLLGVAAPSVLVGVILVIYGANQLSASVVIPLLTVSDEPLFPLVPGVGISAVLLLGAVLVFNRRQL
jgi:ABC-2 type transport system permease protein